MKTHDTTVHLAASPDNTDLDLLFALPVRPELTLDVCQGFSNKKRKRGRSVLPSSSSVSPTCKLTSCEAWAAKESRPRQPKSTNSPQAG